MKMLLSLAAAFLPLASPPPVAEGETAPIACPSPTSEDLEAQKRHLLDRRKLGERVAVLAGVDPLGRVLLAVDHGQDDAVDELFLFTPRERLKGPWSELILSADIESTTGTLRLESHDRSLAIVLAVSPADLPKLKRGTRDYRRVVQAQGYELVRKSLDPAYGRRLSSFDHTLLETWPESFREDLMVPGTSYPTDCWNCGNTPCQVGGCNALTCSTICHGLAVNDECAVGCRPGASFACCNCTNGPFFPIGDCRCRPCRKLVGPIP
jgi:hypothetical protein